MNLKSMTRKRMMDDYELMKCIDSALDKFGPGVKYTVYWRMVVLNQAPSEGIIANPDGFVLALKSIFGNSAAQIEQAIVEEIKSESGLDTLNSLPELMSEVRRERIVIQSLN